MVLVGEPDEGIAPGAAAMAAEGYDSMDRRRAAGARDERGLPTSGTKAELIERLTAPEPVPA